MYGRRVHDAVLASGVAFTGATVHRVVGAYDEGPIVVQRRVDILARDDADKLASRVMAAECDLLCYCIAAFAGDL